MRDQCEFCRKELADAEGAEFDRDLLSTEPIDQGAVDGFRAAFYVMETVIPYTDGPVKNTYYLDQENLDIFLEDYGEYGEFVISIRRADDGRTS